MSDIIIQYMPEGTDVTFHVPDWVKLEIAECVIAFSKLEHKAIEIAWSLKNINEVKARVKAARMPATENFDEILSYIEDRASVEFAAIRRAFEDLAKERNLISHGVWMMAGEKPYVVWHKFLEDLDSVMGEYFEKPRFDRFRAKANKLLETCVKWHEMLEPA
jgi:hypothetical protein